MPAPEVKVEPEYLGDGVYASFDGDHIWLAVNHHKNIVVALEPNVMEALEAYARKVERAKRGDEDV